MLIADSGATNHMWPDYSAFTSYRPLTGRYVTLADGNHAPVTGVGSIKISIDGSVVGVRNVLHVPSLQLPLYSLRAHRRMPGCGFIADNDRFHVYFPTFVASVNDSVDSYIAYLTLGKSCKRPYAFRQPLKTPRTRPAASSTLSSPIPGPPYDLERGLPLVPAPHLIPNYDDDFPPLPTTSPSGPLPPVNNNHVMPTR